jgi:putative methyltransferase (TIGR04325 family)
MLEPDGGAVRVRRLARAVTPPILVTAARQLRRLFGRGPEREWKRLPGGWPHAATEARGWNIESVAEAYRSKLPEFRQAIDGPGPLAIATSAASSIREATVREQNALLVFAYSLALAARRNGRVSVLDWGGGLGYFSLLSRALLPDDVEIDYHCRELPLVCSSGRELLPEVTFWEDDGCLDRRYDLVLASNAIQYCERWSELVPRLARAASPYLLLTRVPVVFDEPSFLVLQRMHRHRFETESPCWIFNRHELLDVAGGAGVELVREFLLDADPRSRARPQDAARSYLFRTSRPPAR